MVVPGLSSRFQVRERRALGSITFPLSTGWYCIEVQDSVLEKYRLSGVVVTGISGASGFAIFSTPVLVTLPAAALSGAGAPQADAPVKG